MKRAAGLAVAVATALGIAAGCVGWQPAPRSGDGAAAAPVGPAMAPAASGADVAQVDPTPAARGTPASAAQAQPASLRDTEADGAWRADAQGHLVVDRALRRRFDYALSAIGEWSAEMIGTQLLDSARRELPPGAVLELQALWQRYVELQRYGWQRAVRPADPSSWRPALEERQSVRRQLLGVAAADAFFGDEEQLLWRQVLALESGQTAPQEAAPAVPEHPQAVQRVAEVEAAWADWEQRLAAARRELQRLRAAPELSGPQRDEAMSRWLAGHFSPGEQRRAQALLGLAGQP